LRRGLHSSAALRLKLRLGGGFLPTDAPAPPEGFRSAPSSEAPLEFNSHRASGLKRTPRKKVSHLVTQVLDALPISEIMYQQYL
jgi:hypothetical protein